MHKVYDNFSSVNFVKNGSQTWLRLGYVIYSFKTRIRSNEVISFDLQTSTFVVIRRYIKNINANLSVGLR